jgi:hypothetical protein
MQIARRAFSSDDYGSALRPAMRWLAIASLVATLGACANSEITGPIPGVSGMMTLNAAQAWQYFSLDQGTPVAPDGPATTSDDWDLGFFTTSVVTNGGDAGPGEVSAYCVCQNASATSAQILAMTPESEAADYDAITLSDVPPATSFGTTTFADRRWYKYNLAGDNRISPTFDVYLVKRGDAYYKVQLTGYYSVTNAPRHITFRYERLVK